MNIKSSYKYEKKDKRLENLYMLIHVFDGLSVLRKTHPDNIEDLVGKISIKKVNNLWRETKKDVEKVVFHPLSIPHVVTFIKIAHILKILIPVSAIYIILVIGYILHPSLFPFRFLINRTYVSLDFSIIILLGFGYILLDSIIRIKVIRYERSHQSYFEKYQKKFKESTQRLINIFLVEIKKEKSGYDNGYEFELFHPDYAGLELIKVSDKHLLVFKKKYPTYIYNIS